MSAPQRDLTDPLMEVHDQLSKEHDTICNINDRTLSSFAKSLCDWIRSQYSRPNARDISHAY